MPRKKKSKVYFGMDVQNAIIEYNATENSSLRNKIYQEKIHKAFDKLAENLINTFKFTYFDYGFEDIKCEVVAFLVMNMHKYDHTKGSKAFSYFSVVAKNYLILHNNNNYKRYKTHDDISTVDLDDKFLNRESRKQRIKEFMEEIIIYLDKNITNIFKKSKDVEIAYAILELMKKREDIENFNKKCLYILIREMANVKTSDITKVSNILKKYYKAALIEYDKHGIIGGSKQKFF